MNYSSLFFLNFKLSWNKISKPSKAIIENQEVTQSPTSQILRVSLLLGWNLNGNLSGRSSPCVRNLLLVICIPMCTFRIAFGRKSEGSGWCSLFCVSWRWSLWGSVWGGLTFFLFNFYINSFMNACI